jgi:hypothetical protein
MNVLGALSGEAGGSSVPVPMFVSPCNIVVYERRNQRTLATPSFYCGFGFDVPIPDSLQC